MPQHKLLSIASRQRVGLHSFGNQPTSLAMPHLRRPVLCLARGGGFSALCPLPQVREFRFGTHFPGTRGARVAAWFEAPATFSRLPLRSVSRKILQRTPPPPYPSLRGLKLLRTLRCELEFVLESPAVDATARVGTPIRASSQIYELRGKLASGFVNEQAKKK
jgi:hypothetical protein